LSRITKRDFITEVSKRSNLRKDVVEDVFKAVVDISIEQIVNHGDFSIKDLFSISSKDYKAYSLAGNHVPAQRRLVVRLSEKIKSFWKLKNEVYPEMGDLTRDELESALKHHNAQKGNSKTSAAPSETPRKLPVFNKPRSLPTRSPISNQQSMQPRVEAEDFNPLLDEDD
jgi:hypothetical protein